MTIYFSRLPAFLGRNWLRLLFVGFALFLLTRKQVNFNIRFGVPDPVPAVVPTTAASEPPTALTDAAPGEPGFFSQFNLFGSSEASLYDNLVRQDEQTVEAFLRRFQNVAQAEQEKFGIPASITLASTLLYTKAGTGPVATELNNFFALPCGGDWVGPTGYTGKRCARAYESAWTSFRDHSLYLTSGRYAPLTQFPATDYRRWAAGLGELGYNDTDDLAKQLLQTVDRYQLFRFD